jgi:DNA repair protein RadC
VIRRPVGVFERPPSDRPRERLFSQGPGALSEAELLAIVLRTGGAGEGVLELSARVLCVSRGLTQLARLRPPEIASIPGVGGAKAAAVVAAFELGRRAMCSSPERPQILRPADCAFLLAPRLAHLDREESHVLLLDRKHRVLRSVVVGVGGVAHAPMEPREVLQAALREPAAAALVVAHNHPSGDPEPSADDLAVTRRLADGAALVGLELVDHVIVAAGGWSSLRERGAI